MNKMEGSIAKLKSTMNDSVQGVKKDVSLNHCKVSQRTLMKKRVLLVVLRLPYLSWQSMARSKELILA